MGPFGVAKAIKVVDSDPFEFGSAVWCWSNTILFAQGLKNFVTHFETGFIQLLDVGRAKNFAHDHKTKLVAIFYAFTSAREREAEIAELFDVHGKGKLCGVEFYFRMLNNAEKSGSNFLRHTKLKISWGVSKVPPSAWSFRIDNGSGYFGPCGHNAFTLCMD
jgi:hypothetical protein